MKYLSTLLLTVILMLSSASYAQSKVAHLDFQKLISEMPSVCLLYTSDAADED